MRLPIIALATLILTGCAGAGPYSVTHQKFDSLTDPFTTDTMYFYGDMLFKAGLVRLTSPKQSYNMLEIEYHGSGWLFMDGKVTIKADDHMHLVQDKNPSRLVAYRGVIETIQVPISDEIVEQMRDAKVVGIEFFGKPIYVDETGKKNIGRFLIEYVKPSDQLKRH